jgi:hypothetical protein
MILADERDIFYYDIKIKSHSRTIKGLSPANSIFLLNELRDLYRNNLASHSYKKDTETIYIADIEIDTIKGYAKLLINRSDQNTADTILSDVSKETRRVIAKKEGEGNDNSSHIIWTLKETSHIPHTYLFISEFSPGLGRGKIQAFLNTLFYKCAKRNPGKFSRKHPDGSLDKKGNTKIINCRPMIELRGHLSNEFKKELEAGKFLSLEVYTPHKQNPYDENNYTKEKSRTVQLVLSEEGKIAEKWALVKSVCKQANHDNQDFLRIKFRNNEGGQRSLKLHSETADIAEGFLYIKKRKINNFAKPLLTSYESFNASIIKKMLPLIHK